MFLSVGRAHVLSKGTSGGLRVILSHCPTISHSTVYDAYATLLNMNPTERILQAEMGRPWWKMCCAGCLLLLVGFFAALFIVIRGLSGPGAQSLAALPPNYPADLPLYRIEDAVSFQYLPGRSKGKLMETLSYPLAWFSKAMSSDAVRSGVQKYTTVLQGTDRVSVTWINVKASRDEVLRAYAELYKKAGMSDEATSDEATHSVAGVARRMDAVIQLYLRDAPDVTGVDQIVVTVDYIPHERPVPPSP